MDLIQTGLVWKSRSSWTRNCFQKFVRMKFYVENIFDSSVGAGWGNSIDKQWLEAISSTDVVLSHSRQVFSCDRNKLALQIDLEISAITFLETGQAVTSWTGLRWDSTIRCHSRRFIDRSLLRVKKYPSNVSIEPLNEWRRWWGHGHTFIR